MESSSLHLRDEYYDIVPINGVMLVKIPKEWKYQKGEKFKAVNVDNTISLTISCYENENCKNADAEFENTALGYFNTFDKHYKPVSEIIREDNVLLKLYNTGKTLEYHAITYVQPMLSSFVIVCYVFHSTRDLEDADIEIFEKISQSTLYKISDLP